MKEIMRLGAILLIFCFVAAALLAVTNDVTYPKIMEQRGFSNENARKEVLAEADSFEKLSSEKLEEIKAGNEKVEEIFIGKKGDQVIGYVVKTLPKGFGGTIKIFTGITTEGLISGVRMGSGHQETPGLGAKAELPEYYEMYNGMSTETPVGVSKTEKTDTEIQAISGATITSQAVTNGVNFAADAIKVLEGQKDATAPETIEDLEVLKEKLRKEVLADADEFEELSSEKLEEIKAKNEKVVEIFIGKKNDEIVGYVVKTLAEGYGGTIKVYTGITSDRLISGVKMDSDNHETPGIGAKAELPEFCEMYNGMSAESAIGVNKTEKTDTEIQAISGATITSQAVTDGVNFAIDAIKALEVQ